jgi:hypothetical protein
MLRRLRSHATISRKGNLLAPSAPLARATPQATLPRPHQTIAPRRRAGDCRLALGRVWRFNTRMPALTRRKYPERPDCWHIYFGDVHAGTIAMRVGNPHDTDQWEWICGFYPGSRPGEIQSGTSATFEDARAEFASAWDIFLSKPHRGRFSGVALPAGFDRVEIRMWDRGCKLPTQLPAGRSKCFCGADLTISGVTDPVRAAHMVLAE